MDWNAEEIARDARKAAELADAQAHGQLVDASRLNSSLARLRTGIEHYLGDERWRRLWRAYQRVALFPDFKPGERGFWLELRQAVGKVLEFEPGAHDGETAEGLRTALRTADEDDVEAALAGSYVEDVLAGVERAALLEFHNRMLDRTLGEPDD